MYQTLYAITHFAAHFSVALLALIIFKVVYTLITPHNEWALIKNDKNIAAALGLGGAIIGFSIALYGVISNSVSLLDVVIWAVVALLAQCLAFIVVRFIFMPRIVKRIEEGEVSAGTMLAVANISVGLLNAACMSY